MDVRSSAQAQIRKPWLPPLWFSLQPTPATMAQHITEDQVRQIYKLLQERKHIVAEIAQQVNCSTATVQSYKKKIEKLLGIKFKKEKSEKIYVQKRSLEDILKEPEEFIDIPPQPGYDERVKEEPIKSYTSRDIGLVAALALYDHRILSVKKVEDNRGEFRFIDVPSLHERKLLYFEDNLPVDAHSYFKMVGKLKSKLYNMQDQIESFTD